MKLIRTNTSRLDLSWSAETPTARALHGLPGTVLVAADCAKVADADVLLDRDDDRSTVSFTVDVPGGASTLPRKPAMAAWNPKSLADAGIESQATETVTLSYAIHGSVNFADQLSAFSQVQADAAAAGYPIVPEAILHTVIDGLTSMSVSFSETVPGAGLDSLQDSKLRALPQSGTGSVSASDFSAPTPGDTVAEEAPSAPAPKAKRAKAAPAATPAKVEAVASAETITPEPAAVAEPVIAAAVEATPEPEVAKTPAPTEPVMAEVIEPPAAPAVAPVPEAPVPAAVAEPVTAEPIAALTPLTVVPALPSTAGDFDAPEPPDFESYPPEEDAPEPQVPDAPDMPDFDINALVEPPVETATRRRVSTPAAPAAPPARPKASSGAATPSPNGKITLTEEDIF